MDWEKASIQYLEAQHPVILVGDNCNRRGFPASTAHLPPVVTLQWQQLWCAQPLGYIVGQWRVMHLYRSALTRYFAPVE